MDVIMNIGKAFFDVGSDGEYTLFFVKGNPISIKLFRTTCEVSVTDAWCRTLYFKRYSSLSSAYRAVRKLQRKYFGGVENEKDS